MSEWISVEDRLPLSLEEQLDPCKGAEPVLIVIHDNHANLGGRVFPGGLRSKKENEWFIITEFSEDDVEGYVSHWMPLPQPPKDDTCQTK